MLVRRATTADIDWLLGELNEFADFLDTSKKLYADDEAYGRNLLTNFIEKHFVLVAERDGARVGFIAGYVMPHMFNPKLRVLAEIWWWVNPAHRKTRAALMLLNEYTKWGKENCDLVTMAVETITPVNERCLTKRGYRLHERSYLLEIE